MPAHHRPAAPAQDRQAHTLHGFVAAIDKAALTCIGFRSFRAVLVRWKRTDFTPLNCGGFKRSKMCRQGGPRQACEPDTPCMPRVPMPKLKFVFRPLLLAPDSDTLGSQVKSHRRCKVSVMKPAMKLNDPHNVQHGKFDLQCVRWHWLTLTVTNSRHTHKSFNKPERLLRLEHLVSKHAGQSQVMT